MKILLIGGTGVLSRDIARHAITKGIEVYLLNRGNNPQESHPKANVIVADIRNKKEVAEKVKDLEFDVVADFLSFNPDQLNCSLELFAHKCNQYIFISSATGYSLKARQGEISENDEFNNEVWDYANGKGRCEAYLKEYCSDGKLTYTIVRPYVTYGDTRIPFAVISGRRHWSLVHRILNEKPIVMWDDGDALCTLTHTLDFAVGFVGLFSNPKAENESFHITSDERFTWNEVLQIIADTLGRKVNVLNIPSIEIEKEMREYKGLLLGDKATNMIFDNSKIKEAVPEFGGKISFKEGIKSTIDYYRSHPSLMRVDYDWDARIDRLILKHCKQIHVAHISRSCLKYFSSSACTFRDWLAYTTARHKQLILVKKIYNRLSRYMKK